MSFNAMSKNFTWDAELVLHDGAAAVTADGAGQVSSAAKILDLSADNISSAAVAPAHCPDTWGLCMVDVSAMDLTSGDELYWILLQQSSSATFASDIITVAALPLGDAAALPGGADVDMGTGEHYVFPFRTWHLSDPTTARRYMRVYFDVTGTTPSITCVVRLGKG